jgi:tetratricopeptide (TPR) repeat protein
MGMFLNPSRAVEAAAQAMRRTSQPGRWLWGLAALAVAALWGGTTAAEAQVTTKTLIQNAVDDDGPQYQDVTDAITRFRSGDIDGARALLERAKRKHPKLAPPEVMMAQLLFLAGRADMARAELEKCTSTVPTDPEPYLIFADLAFSERRVSDAEALFERARTLAEKFDENPKRKRNFQIRALAGLASVAQVREQWKTAEGYLRAWLQLDPDSAPAHQQLGRVLFKQNNARDAFLEYTAAQKADPKAILPELALAQLYEQAGDRDNAARFIDLAVKKAPQDVEVLMAAAQWALATNRLNDAVQYSEAALKADPKRLEARVLRGTIARYAGDLKSAQSHLEAAYLQSPGNFGASNQLALVLAEQDDTAAKQRALELAELNLRAFAQQPGLGAEAASTLGWVYYRMGRLLEAERALGAVVQTGTLSADSAYYVARIIQDRGRTEEAVKLLETALQTTQPFAHRQDASNLLAQLTRSSGGSPQP